MSRLSYLTHKAFIGSVAATGVVLTVGQPSLALQYNPPNRGAPSNTWDAGSRTGPCGNLTAVQPSQTNWGETLEERPTFGIYVSEPATNLTFELLDEQSQEILHQVTFDEVDGPGISLYTLPRTVPVLETNRYYRWQISLECKQFSTANIQYTDSRQADGIIFRRVASDDLQTTLATIPETEKPSVLAENGLWYDMVYALLMQRQQQPETDQWNQAWQTVLAHPMVQLNNLMDAMLIDCCLAVDCLGAAPPNTALSSPI